MQDGATENTASKRPPSRALHTHSIVNPPAPATNSPGSPAPTPHSNSPTSILHKHAASSICDVSLRSPRHVPIYRQNHLPYLQQRGQVRRATRQHQCRRCHRGTQVCPVFWNRGQNGGGRQSLPRDSTTAGNLRVRGVSGLRREGLAGARRADRPGSARGNSCLLRWSATNGRNDRSPTAPDLGREQPNDRGAS